MFLETKRFFRIAALCATLPALLGCPSESTETPPRPDTGVVPPPPPPPPPQGYPESAKANLRFKGAQRLTNDFAKSLSLGREELCNELGLYDCTEVHAISLGGVLPYQIGLYEPPDQTSVVTPIVVERLALSGCERRVTEDFANAGPAIFVGFADGTVADVNDGVAADAITRMYQAALQRNPTASETEMLIAMYGELVDAGADNPAREFAIGICFAVLTSAESIFY